MSDSMLIPALMQNTGANSLGPVAGAFIGSWLARGFGGLGYGVDGYGANAVSTAALEKSIYDAQATAVQVANANQLASNAGFAGVSRDILTSSCTTDQITLQSANGTNSLIQAGLTGIGDVIQNGNMQLNNTVQQGTFALSSAIQQGNADMRYAMSDCCCEVKGAVMSEGAATRQLIQNNLITELQTQLCDSKAKIGSLESQQFTAGLIAAQSAAFDAKLQNAMNVIIQHVVAVSGNGNSK